MNSFIRFYVFLLAITLLQVGVVLAMPEEFPAKDTIMAIIFFGLITGAIYPIAHLGTGNKDGYLFITTIYLSIGIRFFLSIGYVLYYKYTRDSYDISFIFSFFISYILYTIFEIYFLTAKLRPDLNKKTGSDG